MALTFAAYQRWFREYDEARELTMPEASASLGHLMEEVGEIARHVLRLEGHKALNEAEREAEIEALALELADAFVFLTKLANEYGIEWEPTIRRSMQKAETRFSVEAGQREAARRRAARQRRAEDSTP